MEGWSDSWLGSNVWAAWLSLALVLAIVETMSLDLVFLMLAAGAAAAAMAAALGAPAIVQVLVAAGASVALLGVVRPVAKRHMMQGPSTRTGTQALIGQGAVVIEAVDTRSGTVRLSGEVWSARAYDGVGVIPRGQAVTVVRIEGATAVVFPTEALDG